MLVIWREYCCTSKLVFPGKTYYIVADSSGQHPRLYLATLIEDPDGDLWIPVWEDGTFLFPGPSNKLPEDHAIMTRINTFEALHSDTFKDFSDEEKERVLMAVLCLINAGSGYLKSD